MLNPAIYFVDRHINEGRGENIAIECGDIKITYRELSKKVSQFANGLLRFGIKPGERVIIILPDTPEFIISFLGTLKMGAVPVPISTLLSSSDHDYFIHDTEARLVITKASFERIIEQVSDQFDPDALEEGDGCFWLYSSGSTGFPKACVHSGMDMVLCAKSYAEDILHITERDRCFSVSKLFFSYGLGNSLYFPLSVGAATILMPDPPKPGFIMDVLKRYRPTLFFSVPSHYLKLAEDPQITREIFSSVRMAASAGESLPPSLFHQFKKRFGIEILDCVGSTEAFLFMSNRPGEVRAGSSGQLLIGCEAKLGESGDLFIRSQSLFSRYEHQPEKTHEVLHNGWLATGDRFSKDEDGFFYHIGRSDDMIKSSGAWVSPIEIETLLVEHPAVLEAAVIGGKDEHGIMRPVAFVVFREGVLNTNELSEDIKIFAAKKLPHYKQPFRIVVVKELPRTGTGKLQRFRLREENKKAGDFK